MSGATEVEDLYTAIEETARLLDVPCSRDKVWPILTAYGDSFEDSGVVFTVLSGERNAGELDYTLTVPRGIDDPYAHALANGFLAAKDHSVGTLLSDLQGRWNISEYMIDCGVVGGFKKVYVHFPQDPQKVATLTEVPSLPPAVADNAELFARHGLGDVALIAIDYRRETINLYFQLAGQGLDAKTILSLLRESGLQEPSEPMLEFAQRAFRINVTLGWDSSDIVRIALAPPPARSLDPSAHPAGTDPRIERFVRNTPHTYAGDRINLFGVKWTRDAQFLEFGSYYQLSLMQRKIWKAIHKEEV